MCHAVAPLLADRFTLVAADRPGYGRSFRPTAAPDHAPNSKRAPAADLLQAMGVAGFDRFVMDGHDVTGHGVDPSHFIAEGAQRHCRSVVGFPRATREPATSRPLTSGEAPP